MKTAEEDQQSATNDSNSKFKNDKFVPISLKTTPNWKNIKEINSRTANEVGEKSSRWLKFLPKTIHDYRTIQISFAIQISNSTDFL